MKDEKNNQEKSWTDGLMDDLKKLDTDFPLSGGEEPLTPATDEYEDDVFPDVDLTDTGGGEAFPLGDGEQKYK